MKHAQHFKQRTKFKFLRLSSVGNLLKRGFEFYQLSSPSKLILGTLYKEPVIVPVKPIAVEKDAFYDLNNAIIKELAKENNSGVVHNIIVMWEKYPDYYDDVINISKLPVFDLENEFEKRRKLGESIDFWKATNTQGHWNHHGHEVTAEFLFEHLKSIKF